MLNQTKKKSGCSCNFFTDGGLRKTKKSNKYSIKAIVVLGKNEHNVEGIIKFKEEKNGIKIKYKITGLTDGYHGFHIHEYGDLTQGCASACDHFNPFHKNHGSLEHHERHEGDLGNVYSKNQKSEGSIFAKGLCLTANNKLSVLGRMIVVHEKEDDLGMGGDEESLKTGNAGARVACGVIGLCK